MHYVLDALKGFLGASYARHIFLGKDCIYGQCFVAVAWEHDYGQTSTLHTLYIVNRTHKED